jgi:tetratricopeptide (TPR) repeat protein
MFRTESSAEQAAPLDPDALADKFNLQNKYDRFYRPRVKSTYTIMNGFLHDPVSGKTIPLKKLANSRTDPTDPEFELSAIDIAIIDKDYDGALKMAENILEHDPHNVSALIDKARALWGKDDLKTGIEVLDKALLIDPNNACALHNKALYQHQLGNNADALNNLEHSMKIDPNYIPAYGFKFCLLMNLGRHDEALDTLEKGLKIAKSGILTPYQKEELAECVGCKDVESALEEIQKARAFRAAGPAAPTGMD